MARVKGKVRATVKRKRKRASWLCTISGRRVDPFRLRPKDIDLGDAAHGLANICRYTGQVRSHYSVAQHSVLVSQNVPPEDALWGLLHDVSEYILGDIASPLKYTNTFEQYRKLEETVMRCAAHRFGLSWPQPESVTMADQKMVATERRDLLPQTGAGSRGWKLRYRPHRFKIAPWSPQRAKMEFLARFAELTAQQEE